MRHKSFVLLVGLFLWAQTGWTQYVESDSIESLLVQSNRVELSYGFQDKFFHIINAGHDGLLVVKETSITSPKGHLWYLYKLDTALQEEWKKQIVVEYGYNFLGYDYNTSDFILLFSINEYKTEEMLAIKISEDGHDLETHEFNSAIPLDLTHFETVGDGLIIAGESNGRPAVVYYNLRTQRPQVLPGIYNARSSIIDIKTSDRFQMFSVLVNEQTATKDFSVTMKVFSAEGELLYNSSLQTEREKSLVDAVSTNFKNGVQYVAGTYANRQTERSLGFYLTRVQNGVQLFINYHPYADLYNFFSYMKEDRKQRVRKRIERKKIKGKNVKLNYRLLVHDIIRRGEEYILIGEAYYPKYSSSTYNTALLSDPFMASSPSASQQRFQGYQYTHAVVVSFNEDGEILWDDSFEINDVLMLTLEENVQVSLDNDKIVLLYAFDNNVKYKVIDHSENRVGETNVDSIQLKYEGDKLKGSQGMEGLKEWYSGAFYAFGSQRIKNTQIGDINPNRRVFYINKVAVK